MDKPIKVLQIIGDVVGGGVETVIMNYYRNIDKTKIQFDFVVHKGALPQYITQVKNYGGKVYEITSYKSNILKYTYEIYKIIKENNYEIVHSNMNSLSGFSLFAAYLAGAKVRILHNHTTDNPAEGIRTIAKRILRPFARLFANQYWACSKLAAEWMYGKNAVTNAKVTIINNAIDLEKFKFNKEKREKLRKKLGIENCFVIGHVGRFVKTKNHEFLIEIFNEILKQKNNVKLLLIGDGNLKSLIEAKVQNLGIEKAVIFLGVRNDVADLYNVMDVFVFPSFYEGLGMVVIEAQVNGLSVVTSDGVSEETVVTDNIKFLSLQKVRDEWLDVIINAERKEIENNKDGLLKNFDIKSESKKLEALYLSFIRRYYEKYYRK